MCPQVLGLCVSCFFNHSSKEDDHQAVVGGARTSYFLVLILPPGSLPVFLQNASLMTLDDVGPQILQCASTVAHLDELAWKKKKLSNTSNLDNEDNNFHLEINLLGGPLCAGFVPTPSIAHLIH